MDYRRSNMEFGQIQLGAKKGSGKSLDRVPSQGFFYGGAETSVLVQVPAGEIIPMKIGCQRTAVKVRDVLPARQHLIFYDNPSQKRDVRGTNTPHTGAILQVWAREQRLRKGFQGQQGRGSLTIIEYSKISRVSIAEAYFRCRPTACFESLSSAAANKAII